MRLALALLLPVIALASPTFAQVMDCDIAGQSVNPSNGSTTAGKTGLMRCVDRSTRDLLREEELRDGRFVGVKRWYEKGQLRREHSVNERGNRDGRFREWNAQGVLVREGFEANSQSVGLHRSWADDGRLNSVAHWGDGGEAGEGRRNEAWSRTDFNAQGQLTELRCGPQPRLDNEAALCGHQGKPSTIDLFTERGVLASRITHERGQRLRTDTFWDDGKPRSTDELNGTKRTTRQLARDGTKRREVVREDNRTVIEQDYSERGTLVAEKRWSAAGLPEREAQWYLNGQLQREVLHEAPAADGARAYTEKGYRDDGRVAHEGRWVVPARGRALAFGAHKSYDENGRLRIESVYDERGRIKRERAWDETGKLLRDDEVFEDGSRKALGTQP
jgi:antitoxin component YwqK of YwqJK toxin-antitoxin module